MDIVVGASNDTVQSLVNKLRSFLAQECTLTGETRSDIMYITVELDSIQAFLNQLKQDEANNDSRRQDWMKQVRDVAYDIEDCVDNVSHRLSGMPRGSGKMFAVRRAWYLLTKMYERRCIATEIRDLKIRVQQVGERRVRYGLVVNVNHANGNNVGSEGDGNAPRNSLVPPPQLIGTMQPVGMDDAMKELEPWFLEESVDHQLRFLAIVGFSGLGKTTLAMGLYRNFGDKFDCRANVLAMQKFHLPTFLRGLIKQLHEQQTGASNSQLDEIEEWGEEVLKKKLVDQLKEKRYLLFIDDIWSVSAWENIRVCLPKNEKGSTIVVTTRFKSVAEACCSQHGHVYEQKPLIEENSYKLFHQIISSAPDTPTSNARALLKKCGGLPLAIIIVAGLVASKLKSGTQKEIDLHLVEVGKGLGEELEDNLTIEGVRHILSHCYNHLPADLKTCLLYMSMFPRGSPISRKRITRIWIADRFINEKHGMTIEEVAEAHFNELIGRNLIQAANSSSSTGKVNSCTIHDIVLEFIVAKSSVEDFITVAGGNWMMPAPHRKVRRLSVQNCTAPEKEAIENLRLLYVRTLMTFKSSILHSDSLNFMILQLLDLEGCKDLSFRRLMKICTMRQLKYLSLRSTDIKRIPNMIGMLKYLEVLDIRETNVRNLPVSAERLQRMTHLLAGNKNKRIEFTLTQGVPDNLRVLEITWSFDQCNDATSREALLSCIKKQRKFQSLTIHCGAGCSMEILNFLPFPHKEMNKFKVTAGKFVSIPQWIKDLKHLTFLQITVCKLAQNDINMLKELPKLQCLVLDLDFIPREEIIIESEGFHELMRLSIDCPVPWLAFRTGAMTNLTYLQLKFCSGAPSKESVPSGIVNLQRLREVVLCYNKKWCANSSSVKVTIEAVKKEVAKHHNRLDLIINGTIDHVEEVDEESERAIQIRSGHVTPVCEETVRTAAEIQGEIEAEEDNINDN